MKALRILFALFTSLAILTACTLDTSTTEGDETSLTTIAPTKTYGLSDVTKKEIKENKETIIITESIDVSNDDTRDMPEKIIKFIKSVDNTMSDYNYHIISSDTVSLAPESQWSRTERLAITVIFQKNN